MIKRYASEDGGWQHAMLERPDGEWVAYKDYAAISDALDLSTGVNRTKNAELQDALSKLDEYRTIMQQCMRSLGHPAATLYQNLPMCCADNAKQLEEATSKLGEVEKVSIERGDKFVKASFTISELRAKLEQWMITAARQALELEKQSHELAEQGCRLGACSKALAWILTQTGPAMISRSRFAELGEDLFEVVDDPSKDYLTVRVVERQNYEVGEPRQVILNDKATAGVERQRTICGKTVETCGRCGIVNRVERTTCTFLHDHEGPCGQLAGSAFVLSE